MGLTARILVIMISAIKCNTTKDKSDTYIQKLSSMEDSVGSYSTLFQNKNSYMYRSNQNEEANNDLHGSEEPNEIQERNAIVNYDHYTDIIHSTNNIYPSNQHMKKDQALESRNIRTERNVDYTGYGHHYMYPKSKQNQYGRNKKTEAYKQEIKVDQGQNHQYRATDISNRIKNNYRTNNVLTDNLSNVQNRNIHSKRNVEISRSADGSLQHQQVPYPTYGQYPPQFDPYASQVPSYGYPYAVQPGYPGSPPRYIYAVSPAQFNNYQQSLQYASPTPLPAPYGYYGSPTPLPYPGPSQAPYVTPSPQYPPVTPISVYRYSPTPYPEYRTTPQPYNHPSRVPDYGPQLPVQPTPPPLIHPEPPYAPPQIHTNIPVNIPEVFTSFVEQHHVFPSNSHTNHVHPTLTPSPLSLIIPNTPIPSPHFTQPQRLPIPTFQPQFAQSSTPINPTLNPAFDTGGRIPIRQRRPTLHPRQPNIPSDISVNQRPLLGTFQQQRLNEQHNHIPKRPQRPKPTRGSRALDNLFAIAGDDWNPDEAIEKNLLEAQSNFICPGREGHFPDPDSCSVYHQCANGTPTRNTCQEGLMWNMVTNQCDWTSNVDCSLNSESSSFAFGP